MQENSRADALRKQSEEEHKKRVRQRAIIIQAVAATPAGAKLLALLDAEFSNIMLKGKDDSETNYMVGRRDVVVWLQQHRYLDVTEPEEIPKADNKAEDGATTSEEAPRG